MNTALLSLSFFAIVYITVTAFRYALPLIIKTTVIISGLTLIHHHYGQSAMLLALTLTPVLYVVLSDLVGTLTSVKLPVVTLTRTIENQHEGTELTEAKPLVGEWISGKTPEVTHQQILIGDVKALPKPWL